MDVSTWTIKIERAYNGPSKMRMQELMSFPSRTMVSMIECAGNGRVFLVPKENGAQWALGGAGNAEWTGIPLKTVLEKAGLRPGAVYVIFEGADKGEIKRRTEISRRNSSCPQLARIEGFKRPCITGI